MTQSDMTKPRLFIIGAGGHGRVVADCAMSVGRWSSIVFLDKRWAEIGTCDGWPVAGDQHLAYAQDADVETIVAIGNNALRRSITADLKARGRPLATIVHRAAVVSPRAELGDGTVVVAGAIVNVGSKIGTGCIINTGATIDHECLLGDAVHVSPGAHVSGNVTIGKEAWLGTGCAISHGLTIGEGAIVGVGAAVIENVPAGATIVGVPGRRIKSDKQ